MKTCLNSGGGPRCGRKVVIESAMFFVAAVLVAGSAAYAKVHGSARPLAAIDVPTPVQIAPAVAAIAAMNEPAIGEVFPMTGGTPVAPAPVRWFNGRPIRPIRTVWITTTAYSPDARSCGTYADGVTASDKSIWTNSMKLVAADTSIFPMGTMLSVPGYDDGAVVPVLDRGGAIKGARLDLLFASHHEARQWGVQRLPVTIWGYAD